MDKIQGYCLLQLVVHILTNGLQKVSDFDNESRRRCGDSAITAQQPNLAIPRNSTNGFSRIP